MKEFYLVPRKVIDQQKPTAVSVEKPVIRTNPVIHHLLDLRLKLKDYDFAESLLNYFNTSGLVKWDGEGNITSPVTGLNIVDDVIGKMCTPKLLLPADKLPIARLFFSLTSRPQDFFRNTAAKYQVFPPQSLKRQKEGVGVALPWITY